MSKLWWTSDSRQQAYHLTNINRICQQKVETKACVSNLPALVTGDSIRKQGAVAPNIHVARTMSHNSQRSHHCHIERLCQQHIWSKSRLASTASPIREHRPEPAHSGGLYSTASGFGGLGLKALSRSYFRINTGLTERSFTLRPPGLPMCNLPPHHHDISSTVPR